MDTRRSVSSGLAVTWFLIWSAASVLQITGLVAPAPLSSLPLFTKAEAIDMFVSRGQDPAWSLPLLLGVGALQICVAAGFLSAVFSRDALACVARVHGACGVGILLLAGFTALDGASGDHGALVVDGWLLALSFATVVFCAAEDSRIRGDRVRRVLSRSRLAGEGGLAHTAGS